MAAPCHADLPVSDLELSVATTVRLLSLPHLASHLWIKVAMTFPGKSLPKPMPRSLGSHIRRETNMHLTPRRPHVVGKTKPTAVFGLLTRRSEEPLLQPASKAARRGEKRPRCVRRGRLNGLLKRSDCFPIDIGVNGSYRSLLTDHVFC